MDVGAVLFISPNTHDAECLTRMLAPAGFVIEHVKTLLRARARLRREEFPVILTEAQFADGTWEDVLELVRDRDLPASVIVTDRTADDCFWAEVLNLGAYDLLVQPFDAGEVQRILINACRSLRAGVQRVAMGMGALAHGAC